ncbi:MAG: hypothetical protein ABJN26_17305 [Stappiaceae bacterium]
MNKIISSSIAAAVVITGAISVSAPASAAGQSFENANVIQIGGRHKNRKHRHFKRHKRHWGHGHWGHGGRNCHFEKFRKWSNYHGHHIWVKRKVCGYGYGFGWGY